MATDNLNRNSRNTIGVVIETTREIAENVAQASQGIHEVIYLFFLLFNEAPTFGRRASLILVYF